METDEELMLAFQHGSRAAFEQLFARYRQPLYGFFRRRLFAEGRAEDLTQETFLAVLRGRSRYEPRAAVRTYLYAIAMNLLHAEIRRTEKTQNLSIRQDPPAPAEPETGLWVQQAIAKLIPLDREVLLLREYEQLSYDEIAGLLKLPVNTVRSRLFRARQALKALLQPLETSRTEA
jgi:RNA polymerase sigma-70 factor (ECF subfamily)